MNKPLTLIAMFSLAVVMQASFAADEYEVVPSKGARQYKACIATANTDFDGGKDASPVRGQNKSEAYCTCMWSESPEGFEGDLFRWAKGADGKKANATCEKYSNWLS